MHLYLFIVCYFFLKNYLFFRAKLRPFFLEQLPACVRWKLAGCLFWACDWSSLLKWYRALFDQYKQTTCSFCSSLFKDYSSWGNCKFFVGKKFGGRSGLWLWKVSSSPSVPPSIPGDSELLMEILGMKNGYLWSMIYLFFRM